MESCRSLVERQMSRLELGELGFGHSIVIMDDVSGVGSIYTSYRIGYDEYVMLYMGSTVLVLWTICCYNST